VAGESVARGGWYILQYKAWNFAAAVEELKDAVLVGLGPQVQKVLDRLETRPGDWRHAAPLRKLHLPEVWRRVPHHQFTFQHVPSKSTKPAQRIRSKLSTTAMSRCTSLRGMLS
jgi:hypothetical protein